MKQKEKNFDSSAEFSQVFQDADICRIALCDGNLPYIVAMNFGYSVEKKSIYFHTAKKGRKLDVISKNNNVCFQIDTAHKLIISDSACQCTMNFKSIVGNGNISIVQDEKERNYGLNMIMEHYTNKSDFSFESRILNRTCVLKLTIVEMTGKTKG